MGFLYPRLLSGHAKPMHKAYRHLTLAELTSRASTAHEAAVYVATGGDRISPQMLLELREKIVALAQEAGFPGESTRERRGGFDLHLAALLHTDMRMAPAEAASGDVWAFFALVLLPDVAYWRYPKPPGDRVLGTDITRHVFGRLWWRAHLVSSHEDPGSYAALKVLGEAAFDQIYARRKALGGSPHLVKAILRVWAGLDLRGPDEREILRDFLKRLLRLAPFVLFDALDDESLDNELRLVVQKSITAMRGASYGGHDEQQAVVGAINAADQMDAHASSSSAVVAPGESSGPSISAAQPSASTDERREEEQDLKDLHGPLHYKEYEGPGFGNPRVLGLRDRAEAIIAVVSQEGPVNAERVYRIITHFAGTYLRGSAEEALVAATEYAERTGKLAVENQVGRRGYLGATLRMPDQPLCVLRERGPRDLDEIPDRELAAAASLVQAREPTTDIEDLAKKTSQLFGYERSTERFRSALIDALRKYGI